MNAIEVLKNIKKKYLARIDRVEREKTLIVDDETMQSWRMKVKSLKEAIVALEQKEKLKEWLEKEIRDCEKLENIVQLEINKDIFTIKKNVLKEVLERVGEQK